MEYRDPCLEGIEVSIVRCASEVDARTSRPRFTNAGFSSSENIPFSRNTTSAGALTLSHSAQRGTITSFMTALSGTTGQLIGQTSLVHRQPAARQLD